MAWGVKPMANEWPPQIASEWHMVWGGEQMANEWRLQTVSKWRMVWGGKANGKRMEITNGMTLEGVGEWLSLNEEWQIAAERFCDGQRLKILTLKRPWIRERGQGGQQMASRKSGSGCHLFAAISRSHSLSQITFKAVHPDCGMTMWNRKLSLSLCFISCVCVCVCVCVSGFPLKNGTWISRQFQDFSGNFNLFSRLLAALLGAFSRFCRA